MASKRNSRAVLLDRREHDSMSSMRQLADQAFSRAAGAPLIAGNRVRLLKDAGENYPAWLDSIRFAERTIHFESYIIHEDDIGHQFAEALLAKARDGVTVRVIYDWLGALGTSRRFWKHLQTGGVEVRCYNPPRLDSPFGWVSRDHRKMIAVDGKIGFVTGLCVGRMWVGDPERHVDPWRDTGVEVRGPAVADLERAFAQVWGMMGDGIPEDQLPVREDIAPAGEVSLRVVASVPNTAGMFRLDQLVASMARERLWITDPYYAGTAPYVQALRAAARDGVDVRFLAPGATDIPVLRPLSRAGFRPLLEAGIRVFEWNGSMLHAKTAVADRRWARVGSTNLNIASWLGNCELDVAIEDHGFAREMEEMYVADLANSTELVLDVQDRLRSQRAPNQHIASGGSGSAGRAVTGVLRLSNAVGAAISGHRVLGPVEAQLMLTAGVLLLAAAILISLVPSLLIVPALVIALWLAIIFLYKGYQLHRRGVRARAK